MTRAQKTFIAIAFTAALTAGTAAPALAENHPDSTRPIAQDHFPDSPAPVSPGSQTGGTGR
jgi:hypothetical protein